MEVIILAGGLGTRLKTKIPSLPKCLAPINEEPFISYLINYLRNYRVHKIILSLGYKNSEVLEYLKKNNFDIPIEVSIEDYPLGTGGAIFKAIKLVKDENFCIINGDTYYNIDLNKLFQFHLNHGSFCTIGLKPMKLFDRYGTVQINIKSEIIGFIEKKFCNEGLINGGVLFLNKQIIGKSLENKVFSLEDVYIKNAIELKKAYGMISDDYFIDIGIPSDYERAQMEFKKLIFIK